MEINITVSGTYEGGDWCCLEVEAQDGEGQTYQITRDTDETYCVTSKLIGDDEGESFVGGLTFADAWMGMAHAFGVVAE